MQLYVNRYPTHLDSAIKAASGLSGQLQWVSPIRADGYKEYKDAAFLRELGLTRLAIPLCQFWPASGPRWDGLARVDNSDPLVVVLIEAKNYPREVRGGGCKAAETNGARRQIKEALQVAGAELGIQDTNGWMGPLYQYANRLAHVAFLRRHGVEAFMINVCFYGDPHPARNTSEQAWRDAADDLKKEIGFAGATPSWLADVFLPAADKADFFAPAI
jgi:hypothetical protein